VIPYNALNSEFANFETPVYPKKRRRKLFFNISLLYVLLRYKLLSRTGNPVTGYTSGMFRGITNKSWASEGPPGPTDVQRTSTGETVKKTPFFSEGGRATDPT
jgi:hypothetical protein